MVALTRFALGSLLFATLATTAACTRDEPPAGTTSRPLAASSQVPAPAAASIHPLTMKRLDGSDVSLSTFAGKVLLIVNTASECGYTPQYEGLEALHTKYQGRGFLVLGFPSNDFGEQEPGSAEEIASFCKTRFGVTFPMFAKVKTIGPDRSGLYAILAQAKGEPKWNFHKYLVDKRGVPIHAWPSATTPDSPEIASAIEAALASP